MTQFSPDTDNEPVILPSDIDAIEHAEEYGKHRDLDNVGPDGISTDPTDVEEPAVDFTDPIYAEPISTRIETAIEDIVVVDDGSEELLENPVIDPRGWDHDNRTFLEKVKDAIDGVDDGK